LELSDKSIYQFNIYSSPNDKVIFIITDRSLKMCRYYVIKIPIYQIVPAFILYSFSCQPISISLIFTSQYVKKLFKTRCLKDV